MLLYSLGRGHQKPIVSASLAIPITLKYGYFLFYILLFVDKATRIYFTLYQGLRRRTFEEKHMEGVKQFFLIGAYVPPVEVPHLRLQCFSAVLTLRKVAGSHNKWAIPKHFNLCLHGEGECPPICRASCFEWNEQEDTAVLSAYDLEKWPPHDKIFTFLIGPPGEEGKRNMGLTAAELAKANRGTCQLVSR